MKYDGSNGKGKAPEEEVQGAPPVPYLDERLSEQVVVNRYLHEQLQNLQDRLVRATGLASVVEVLLVNLPRMLDLRVCELWLYDADDALSELMPHGVRNGECLSLHTDQFAMDDLHSPDMPLELIEATDPRMFNILKSSQGIEQAILLPLRESGQFVGSIQLGATEFPFVLGEAEQGMLEHLARVASACLKSALRHQQLDQLAMLDPLTLISNTRGFRRDFHREVSRGHRSRQPVSMLVLDVDEYSDLEKHYGERRSEFVLKRVAQRLSSTLRATDSMGVLDGSMMAVLLPATGEVVGQDIAERMRQDIHDFAIDDGRGAVLHVTLSLGLVCWQPQQYPAVDREQLVTQMESAATRGLQQVQAGGGNGSAMIRLSTLMT